MRRLLRCRKSHRRRGGAVSRLACAQYAFFVPVAKWQAQEVQSSTGEAGGVLQILCEASSDFYEVVYANTVCNRFALVR